MLGVEPDDFSEIFSAFPSLMLTLDTGHANLADYSGNRLFDLIERFGDRIRHLHFSDNSGRSDDHRAIGKGTISFSKLIKRLYRLQIFTRIALGEAEADGYTDRIGTVKNGKVMFIY